MATHAITELAIVLKPEDDVAVARREIRAGTVLEDAGAPARSEDVRREHRVWLDGPDSIKTCGRGCVG